MTEQVLLRDGVVVRVHARDDRADVVRADGRREALEAWHWEDALVNAIARGLHRLRHPRRG